MARFIFLLWVAFVSCGVAETAELIIFTADWCKPCQQIKDDIKNDPTIVNDYDWGYVDFDAEKELKELYSITSVPTFLILEDNAVLFRQTGYFGSASLKQWLQNNQPLTNN